MKNIGFYILIIIVLFGCQTQEISHSNPDEYETINIDESQFKKEFLLSENIVIHKVIRLETNSDCPIGKIDNIQYHNSQIYILDRLKAQSIFVFDSTGVFLEKISRIGRGPGEFFRPDNFAFDKSTNRIYILDSNFKKVNIYDESGQFEKAISIDFLANDLCISKNGNIIFSGRDSLQFYITNPNGQVLYNCLENVLQFKLGLSKPLSQLNDEVFLVRNFDDTIYSVINDKLLPGYYINFGENVITRDDVLKQNLPRNSFGYYDIKIPDSKMHNVSGIAFNDKHLRFYFSRARIGYMNIFDRTSLKLLTVANSNVKDDIFNKSMYQSRFMAKDKFIGIINPTTMSKGSLKELNTYINTVGLSENSNPILVFYSYDL
jgi:hypothetical protein